MSFIKHALRWIFFSVICGILAGLAAAAFLILLDWTTQARLEHQKIIWLLPIGGLFLGWIYHRFGREVDAGSNLILDEIHDPGNIIPIKMAPLIFLGTILTHLFGGSVGREGTAVQMGASLSDQLSHFFKIEPDERKILLVAGAGAGFGAAIGAPWAGMIFGMEVIAIGRIQFHALFQCFIASFVGYYVTIFIGAKHSAYPHFDIPGLDLRTALCVAIAGCAFGFTAVLFSRTTHVLQRVLKKFIAYPPLRPFLVGILIVVLYRIEGTYRFAGLGISEIQNSLLIPSSFSVPALKAFFTALTISAGFKGGEFVPLVFIGATLGSALSTVLPVAFPLLAGLGFAGVFAGAANTPIACSLMAGEIFGWAILPYAAIACLMSYYCSGHRGIYSSQRVHAHKHRHFYRIGKYFK